MLAARRRKPKSEFPNSKSHLSSYKSDSIEPHAKDPKSTNVAVDGSFPADIGARSPARRRRGIGAVEDGVALTPQWRNTLFC